MKKVTLIMGALALVLGLSQCRKPNAPTINGNGETQHVTLTSSFGGDGSKLDVQTVLGSLNLKWEEGDVISIAEPNSGSLVCVSASYDEATKVSTGTFDGTITHNSGDITFTVGNEPKYKEQDGGEINEDKIYLVGTSEYKSDGNYNVDMNLPYAILKLDLHGLVSSTGDVTITAAASAKGEAETVAKVLNVMPTSTDMYVMIPVEGTPAAKDYTFTGDAGSYTIKNKTLTSNTFFTAGGTGGTTVMVPTVNFGTPNIEWALCNLGATNGATAESWYGSLYAWGETTAYNEVPNAYPSDWTGSTSSDYKTLVTGNTPKTNYTYMNYKWGESADYESFTIYKYTGSDSYGNTLSADDDAAHAIWGGDWRMPTKEEWQQLLDNNTFENLAAGATSTNVPSFTAVVRGYLVVKGKDSGLDNTKYMFLPAAGQRWGDEFMELGMWGNYWSSSLVDGDNRNAVVLMFACNTPSYLPIPVTCPTFRNAGNSVRPVR